MSATVNMRPVVLISRTSLKPTVVTVIIVI